MKFIGTIRTRDKGVTVRLSDRRFVNQVATANARDQQKIAVYAAKMREFWQKENKATAHA